MCIPKRKLLGAIEYYNIVAEKKERERIKREIESIPWEVREKERVTELKRVRL